MIPRAARAFDAIAGDFDARFGGWRSVAAQRAAVRRALLSAFPENARLLELGGGTGEDAIHLAQRGRHIMLTDGAPAMIARAAAKIRTAGLDDRVRTAVVALEGLEQWAAAPGTPRAFDGAFSNFAALNCLTDLRPCGRGLARLLAPGARALLVVFGSCALGEVVVELARGRPRNALRRFRYRAPARLGNTSFAVRYPSPRRVAQELAPWFRLRSVTGIGVLVPPSAAEPWISRHPRLLAALERADRVLARPAAHLADHVLLDFERCPLRRDP